MKRTCLLILILAGICTMVRARRQFAEDKWHEVTTEFETPHTDWGKPLRGEALDMLCIAPRCCQRDTAELAQRLDIDHAAFGTWEINQFGWHEGVSHTHVIGFSPADKREELMRKLDRKPSVIAFGNFHWKLLPMEAQYRILRQVRDGAGLLLSFYQKGQNEHFRRFLNALEPAEGAEFITSGVPLSVLPAWDKYETDRKAARQIVSTHKFGRGRVVLLRYKGYPRNSFLVPKTGDSQIFHVDYYFSLAARAALWAARRETPARLGRFELCRPDGSKLAGTTAGRLPEGARVAVSIRDIQAQEGIVWLRLRGRRGEAVLTKKVPVGEFIAPKQYLLALRQLPAGVYYVDAIARDSDGIVLGWWSTHFTVTSKLEIEGVQADKETVAPGGTVTMTAGLSAPAPENCTLKCTVTDTLDRVIERAAVEVGEGSTEADCELSFARAIANLAYVDAELDRNGRTVSRTRVRQPVNAPLPKDDFGFLCWLGESEEYPWRFVRQILSDYGVDCSNIRHGPVLAEANIRVCPYSTRLHPRGEAEKPHVRKPCLTDPEYRNSLKKRLTDYAETARLYGPVGYSLGDENALARGQEFCWSDTCKAYYRDYLKEEYGTLQAVNEDWGSEYESWQAIEPITLKQARDRGTEGAFAQWADHRMCMEAIWVDIHQFCRDVIHSVDPGARVGDEGSGNMNSYTGYDWWGQAQVMDVWNIYPSRRHVLEMIHSFGQPDTYSGCWYGGYVGWSRWESRERWMPWYSVLHDLTAAWWFKAYSQSRETCQEDAIAADLRPFQVFQWTAEEIADIKHGFGKLLLNCRRDNYDIAVLYSQPSVHASTIDRTFGRVRDAEQGTLRLLEDLGVQYDFVAYAELKEGFLQKRGYRALIAPCCLALSSAEKKAITRFVNDGGVFIADVRPGMRDGHCKRIDDSDWQQFLGVQYGEVEPLRTGDADIAGAIGDRRVKDATLRSVDVDAGCSATSARALGNSGGAPVVLVGDHAEDGGGTILLNFTLSGYAGKPAEETAGLRAVFGKALASVGIRPAISVTGEPGPIFDGEVITYTDGNARYVALLRDESQEMPQQKLHVSLPEGYEVYDSRSRRHLGSVTSVDTTMEEGTTDLYALLPYVVRDVHIKCPTEIAPGGELQIDVAVEAAGGSAGRHVIRVDLIGPDGKVRGHYGANVEARDGTGDHTVKLALNDTPGRWAVRARDVSSGVSDTTRFTVEKEN